MSRDLLAASRLEEFKEWVVGEGYTIHPIPLNSVFEVLRITGHGSPMLIFYRKTADRAVKLGVRKSDEAAFHITVPKEAYRIVRRFIRETKS